MKYEKANDEKILTYYETQPEHRQLVIDDWNNHEDTDLEWGKFDDITEFVIVPDVGIVPTYVEDFIKDELITPDWESNIYEIYRFMIFKILWFVAFYREEYGSPQLYIYPLEKYDEVVREAESLETEYYEAVYGHWFEWKSREFSNQKRFISIDLMPDLAITELEEIESLPAPGYDEPEDLRASLFNTEDGKFYVGVNYLGSISIMSVESEKEARTVMEEIWE